ncbi:MAG: hydrogenase maturation factor, partial [Agathobacter sp.]|nr:hydrogenase maturation factor [Agathobacter sp.]
KEEDLRTRYAQPFIDKAKTFGQMMSIIPEAAVATKSGVSAMHDMSEGGVFGALWELAESAGVGLEIDLKKIPIRQETIEICEFFGLNPYKLLSGGSLLIATEDGNGLVMELEKADIPAAIIGKATDTNGRVLINEDERRFLETTQTDELYQL